MTEMLGAVTSLWNLLWVLGVFGVAPRLVLRLIVRAYPPDHPRRQELKAELNAVPRIKRPVWVAEQLEIALFEGLRHRISAALRRLADRRRAPEQTDEASEKPRTLDEAAERRRLLAYGAAVMFSTAVLGADRGQWLPSPAQTPTPSKIGMTDVKQVEAATRAMRALDYQFGGGACRDAVVAQLSWAERLQSASCQEEVRQRLLRVLGELRNLARGQQN